ncbi:signal transduction histidine kinase [Saccharothrix ecbatanensis]|uniref:histidine kinase n=1 Tax=Saccharothrix ecbatanensis TaxID=1105145 RepID=A0A7W9HSY9_9PSEU|nr:sensor histidine kinase [Saccharothrix ecbatanensis]MBB5807932.1 signal transduction histidine kinase [Saccharothrix ecbatanensis]
MTQVRKRLRASFDAVARLVGGLGTALLALAVLVWLGVVALLSCVGVGVVLLPAALRALRAAANRERARLDVLAPGPAPRQVLAALREVTVRRELAWLLLHATAGLVAGFLGLAMPATALQNTTYPFWYHLLPPEDNTPSLIFWAVTDFTGALAVGLTGVFCAAFIVGLGPALVRAQEWPGRYLLAPPAGTDLSLRVAELTATRAAALDAHAAELRRIERSLHDGTQNRLVAVTVLLGAARRALDRDPATAGAVLDRAQDAAEQALAELRAVARSILPPVLADRGLSGALAGLAGSCGVPCEVVVDVPGRCAASVEATAYFVVAEALSNVAKHSGAASAVVAVCRDGDRLLLRIGDDGRGGADERGGSGLSGIRQRVEAHDGRFTLDSPPGGPTTMRVELPCGS